MKCYVNKIKYHTFPNPTINIIMNNMIEVSKEEFYKFINNNSENEVQGETFHSKYYLDNEGNKIAYMETSSWGGSDIFKIHKTLQST